MEETQDMRPHVLVEHAHLLSRGRGRCCSACLLRGIAQVALRNPRDTPAQVAACLGARPWIYLSHLTVS